MIQFNKYSDPAGDAERLAAIAARRYLWGDRKELDAIPNKLPKNFFYKQEVVACLGLELSHEKFGITYEQFKLYSGFPHYAIEMPSFIPKGEMVYQPRNSGFFSVIENIVVASFVAAMNEKTLVLDGTYDWWGYTEPFQKIFPHIKVVDRLSDSPQAVHFESMREAIFNADDKLMHMFMAFKEQFYREVRTAIDNFYDGDHYSVANTAVVYVRAGDKLQTETIEPPPHSLIKDLYDLSRRSLKTFILSDDHEYAEKVRRLGTGNTRNITPVLAEGYHHDYGGKVSCMHILKNYIALANCKESVSCPSANLVNAAHWTRGYGSDFNPNCYNPVYRYALI